MPLARMGVRGKGRQSLALLSAGATRSAALALRLCPVLTHRIAARLNAVRVVHDAVEDAVTQMVTDRKLSPSDYQNFDTPVQSAFIRVDALI